MSIFNKKRLARLFFASVICNETPTQKSLTGTTACFQFILKKKKLGFVRVVRVL